MIVKVENTFILKTNSFLFYKNKKINMISESVKDRVVNFYLYLKSLCRKLFSDKFGNDEPNKNLFVLKFSDNFNNFDESKWRIGQPWGMFHKDNPTQYYGIDSVYVENDHLVLDTKYHPKNDLTVWDSEEKYNIPYSVGLISSLDSFGYGFYEFEVDLPKGIGLWPAVWLTAVDTWPPEIDMIEAYSDENSNYGKKFQTNLHFDFNPNKKNSGARNHPLPNINKRLKISCLWSSDIIKIYYNGYLVRQITSKKVLKWFEDKKMIIVINNALRNEYIKYIDNNEITKFKVYSVKYWIYEKI